MKYQISVFNECDTLIGVLLAKNCDITVKQSIFYCQKYDLRPYTETEIFRVTSNLLGFRIAEKKITLLYECGSVEILKV